MARLDDGAPFEHEKYYTGANNVNSLQGNQGKFTPDYYAQTQDAIGIIRSSGYPNASKIANDRQKMLNNGEIYIDPTLGPGTHGLTSPDVRTNSGVTLNVNPDRYDGNYLINQSRRKPITNWQNAAELSITLMHEYQHAALQSNSCKVFHPSEREDRAYAAAQTYIGALGKSNSKTATPAWLGTMYDQ